MGNPWHAPPMLYPHRRLPAEHTAVVAGRPAEMSAWTSSQNHEANRHAADRSSGLRPPIGYDGGMSPTTEPWDGREPITEALERRGLRDVFQLAVDHGRREEAIEFLCDVGADNDTAERMVEILIPDEQSEV